MGQLSMSVGPVTSALTLDNDKMVSVLSLYEAAYSLQSDGTPQGRLDAVVAHLGRHIKNVADSQNRKNLRAAADQEADSNPIEIQTV